MSEHYEVFDAARQPLTRGVNFVEASAGTGKTYTITMVVLRVLVELNIPIDKILIVTFTKAATEELKTRIRERLIEVRNLLNPQQQFSEGSEDETVTAWLATIKNRGKAYQRIELALYDIDRAGIFTIHGFCQRMLSEQALESNQLFDVELVANVDTVITQVAEDFWRTKIYSLSPLATTIFTSKFSSPDSLLASVAKCLGTSGNIEPAVDDFKLKDLLQALADTYAELSAWWLGAREELYSLFSEGIANGYFKKKGIAENFSTWFQQVHRFFSGEYGLYPENIELLGSTFLSKELNGTKLRGEKKKQQFLAAWPLADDNILKFVETTQKLCLALRLQLAFDLREKVQTRLELQGHMGFDDLIKRLSSSLKGPNGPLLKKAIGGKFSVALVDEFQDTDINQYSIFSSLFHTTKHYLYLIGDPKQAIYKFRGADIYSYFKAREKADRYLTLASNYRSHPFPIGEVNRLFSSKEKPFWFAEDVLSYRNVAAANKVGDMDIYRNENSLAGIHYCQLSPRPEGKTGRWTSGGAADLCINYIVSEIITLLEKQDGATLVEHGSEDVLNAKDIAILVRTNKQAEEYRSALVSKGVPAIVASKRSVYQTEECLNLYRLLLAILFTGEITRLKTAMTIPWFGYSGDQLYEIWQDEEAIGEWHEKFSQYNLLWMEKGFLSMMLQFLREENVYPNLARKSLAERSIANIGQLLDLIQEKENSENLGGAQLLQWLETVMQDGGKGEDSELLLESDEDAVQLVTMHGAKGLEYPIVFCPYLWYRSNRVKYEKHQVKCFTQETGVVVDLGSELFEQRRQQESEEEFAEDLRLLYVAVTRAKLSCYIMWADVQASGMVADSFQSPLGYLLFSSEHCSHDEQLEVFSKLAKNRAVHHKLISPAEDPRQHRMEQPQDNLAVLQPSNRSLHTDWQMSSFSGLVALSEYGLEQNYHSSVKDDSELIYFPNLPAGAHFGNVVHDLLEQNRFSDLAIKAYEADVLPMIQEKCDHYGVDSDPLDVLHLLQQVVQTPLNTRSGGDIFSLASVGEQNCLKEMGFYFRLNKLVTEDINDLLREEDTFIPLGTKMMRGYLTGFIDLLCKFDNKYYIIDYKTNYLGTQLSDYGPEKLVDAMAAHNYGLQYWIYTCVLHRHLRNLIPGYSYKVDFGGVIYLFLRGMSPACPNNGIFRATPDNRLLEKLDKVLGDSND